MKNLMLLWLCLLNGHQCGQLMEALPTNNTFHLDMDNETYNTELHPTYLYSESDFRTHEIDLINTTPMPELSGTTYNTSYNKKLSRDDTFTKDGDVNNGSNLEVGDRNDQEVKEKQENYEYNKGGGRGGAEEEEEESTDGNVGNQEYEYQNDDDNNYGYSDMIISWWTIWSVIGAVGIISNICLCMVFVFRKEMRTSPNMMIINLAVSDIFSIIFNIILFMVDSSSSSWQAGDFLCKFYYWARFTLIGASVYSVVVISLQRFFVFTIYFKSNATKCLMVGKYKPFLLILFVWILTAALASRFFIYIVVEDFQCYASETTDDFKRDMMIDLTVYSIIPLLIIGFSTVVTSIRLKKSAVKMPGEVSVENVARRNRVVSSNVLLALTIVFALSYVPFFSYYTYCRWNEIIPEANTDNAVYGLLFINSCFNPVALFIMSRKYRRILIDIICRKQCVHKFRDTSENSTVTIDTRL